MHAHLSLERICGPEPVAEFRDCARCGIALKQARAEDVCTDCPGVDAYRGNNSQGQGFPPIDPAYEVALHYTSRPQEDPTAKTLDALKIPYFSYSATKEPIEVAYAESVAGDPATWKWPIVLVTSHGKVIDWWCGYNLQAINAIPAARKAATNPEPQQAQSQPGVPIEQEQAA